jgi:hypothetical protein
MDNVELCLVIAIVLFVIAGVMSVQVKAWVQTLTSFGLAVLALAFLVNP